MPGPQEEKTPRPRRLATPGTYHICPTCGEPIVVPLTTPPRAPDQTYTEDCPVCCHPNIIHVESDPDWTEPRIWAESE